MRPLRDLSRPHLTPIKRPHTTRSFPPLKRRDRFFRRNKVKRSDPYLWDSFESDITYSTIRVLSPRPEPDSRTPSPSLQTENMNHPLAPKPLQESREITVESIYPSPSLPLNTKLDQGTSPFAGFPMLPDTPQSLSEQGSATEESRSEDEALAAPIQGMGTPRIDISDHSGTPCGGTSNPRSFSLSNETAPGGYPEESCESPLREMSGTNKGEGPAPKPSTTATKDFARPQSEHSTGLGTQGTPSNIPDPLQAPVAANSETLSTPGTPQIPAPPETPNALGFSRTGIPIDQTGSVRAPPTPTPSLTKKQKVKVGFKRTVHKVRRIFLRRCILTPVLGRELAEHVCVGLKMINKGLPLDTAGGALGTVKGVAPVPT